MDNNPNPVAEVIEKAGSQTALAKQLGVSQQLVSQWLCRGYVSIGRLVEIETLYGVPRGRLIDPRLKDLLSSEG